MSRDSTRSPARLAHLIADQLHVHLHGACMGAGIEVPALAHHVIAAPDTVIALPELGLGLVPGAGGTASIPRRIGRQRTAALALSGARIDAATALAWGLVDEIVVTGVDPTGRAARARAGTTWFEEAWQDLGAPGQPGRMSRLDRGWSTVLNGRDANVPANVRRVRNIGADVAVGDWVVPSDDGERVELVLARRSAFVRRASFEGARAEADTLAANIDVVFLTHSVGLAAQPATARARARAGLRQRGRAGRRADQGRPRRRPRAGAPRAAAGGTSWRRCC